MDMEIIITELLMKIDVLKESVFFPGRVYFFLKRGGKCYMLGFK